MGYKIGQDNIDKNLTEKDKIEILWSRFKTFFWVIFGIKTLFTYGLARSESWTNYIFYTLNLEEAHLIVINLLIQLILIISMMYVMGYYAYKISGEYKKIWKGLWGLLWFAIVSIFIGYYAVKKERDNKLSKIK